MTNAKLLVPLLGIIATVGCATARAEDTAASSTCSDLPREPVSLIKSCPACGGNSPFINRFPVRGINARGCRNGHGWSQKPDKLKLANKPPPGSEDVPARKCPGRFSLAAASGSHEGELVAQLRGVDTECRAGDLVGATFELKKDRATRTVKIAGRGLAPTRTGALPAYRFTAASGGASLCQTDAAASWEKSAYTAARWPSSPHQASEYALVVGGEVFAETGLAMAASQNLSTYGWFNLACVEDGLAKERLFGMSTNVNWDAPKSRRVVAYGLTSDKHSELDLRRAALHMVTANYCGNYRHYTVEGIPFDWYRIPDFTKILAGTLLTPPSVPASVASSGTVPMPDPSWTFEALWNQHGVVCVHASRLWQQGIVIPEDRIPGECLYKACDERTFLKEALAQCRPSAPDATVCTAELAKTALWASFVTNHL